MFQEAEGEIPNQCRMQNHASIPEKNCSLSKQLEYIYGQSHYRHRERAGNRCQNRIFPCRFYLREEKYRFENKQNPQHCRKNAAENMQDKPCFRPGKNLKKLREQNPKRCYSKHQTGYRKGEIIQEFLEQIHAV